MSFPTTLQDLDATRGATGNPLSTPNHITHHALEDQTIEALEAKVGADGSAVTTSHDYKLGEVTGTDKAVGKTAIQTLTNKTLTTPTLDTPVVTVLSSMQHTHASAAQGGQITDSALSSAVGISKGGTGQTSKAPAFDALQPMTTGGDLIYGGASGTGTRLANGVSGQVLTSAGGTAAPTWTTISNKLFASTADVQVNNTAADTNLLSVTIPANTMGTSDGFKARLFFSTFHTGASTAMDLKVKYGGTTMNTITFPASSSAADKGYVDIYILGAGGTSAQESYVDVNISADNLTANNTQVIFLRATSNGTAAVDSTSAQTFAVSIDPVSAQANQDVVMTGYVISKL